MYSYEFMIVVVLLNYFRHFHREMSNPKNRKCSRWCRRAPLPLLRCNLGENAVEMTAFLPVNILDRIVCMYTTCSRRWWWHGRPWSRPYPPPEWLSTDHWEGRMRVLLKCARTRNIEWCGTYKFDEICWLGYFSIPNSFTYSVGHN